MRRAGGGAHQRTGAVDDLHHGDLGIGRKQSGVQLGRRIELQSGHNIADPTVRGGIHSGQQLPVQHPQHHGGHRQERQQHHRRGSERRPHRNAPGTGINPPPPAARRRHTGC